jgi:GxxExxY protein
VDTSGVRTIIANGRELASLEVVHHRGTEGTEGSSSRCTHDIVGAAIEVHRRLGPGLLESAYETCLCRELALRGISCEQEVPLPVYYRGLQVDCGYRLDLVVQRSVIVEVKAVSKVLPVHRAQLLTYLKLTSLRLGLLINFNVEVLRTGIYRIING